MKFSIFTTVLCVITISVFAQKDIQKKFQTQFIDVSNGGTIELPAGNFQLDASLWLDEKKNVTIKGAGIDKTVLSFKGQISGAEGIKITNSSAIILQDLAVQDTKGDAIKTQMVDGITFKNSKATQNVAGIEIENSWYADVFDNEAYNNTGGILIFDLPDLIQKEGGYVRVFKNNIHDNNHINFAPKGNTVGKVPQGTGLMILATRHVEAFENKIVNNISAGTAIVSYHITENPINDKAYNPFPADIYIHDNYYERPNVKATSKGRLGKMYKFKLRFGKDVPHILYDGIEDKDNKNRNICIKNNTNASFVNIDAEHGFKNKSRDMTPHDCTQSPISPVNLTARTN